MSDAISAIPEILERAVARIVPASRHERAIPTRYSLPNPDENRLDMKFSPSLVSIGQ